VWNDPKQAEALGRERARLDGIVGELLKLDSGLVDAGELLEMAAAEDDDDTVAEIEADVARFEAVVERLEFKCFHGHSGGIRRHRSSGLG
jgi:peptide chain release factor 2